jgi:8-amino-7-oxononanoate synthase
VASLAALKVLQNDNARKEKLKHLIQFFIKNAKERNIPLISYDATPIKSILIGDNKKTLSIQQKLLNHGFLVSCIRPPSVPKNSARIKISLNCAHQETDILQLLDLIQTC